MPAEKKARSRSRFSHLTDAGTTLATVFSYLNGELSKTLSQREGKQRATDALLAFWKPYALQAQQADANRIQNAAQSSIEALFRQIQTICDDFGIELPMMRSTVDLEALVIAVAKHIRDTAEPTQHTALIAGTTAHAAPSERLSQKNDAIFADDGDLLGDLE